MEFDLTPHPIFVVIQGSNNTLNPIEEYCQKNKLNYEKNELFEGDELIIHVNSKESDKHWHHIQDNFKPQYLNLEYRPPYLDQRWISRNRHRHLWPKNDTNRAPISIQKLIKTHFDEHLKALDLEASFYDSKLYYSMLLYITLEFISDRNKMLAQGLTPVSEAYFELIKKWKTKELKKYQSYHLDTLQELKIIS